MPHIRDNGPPDKPEGCPEWVYIIIHQCWAYVAQQRPPFLAIFDCLTSRYYFTCVLVTPFELCKLIASLVKDTFKVMFHYFISSNILLQKRESKHMFVIAISTGNAIRNYSSLGKRTHLMHSKAKYRI